MHSIDNFCIKDCSINNHRKLPATVFCFFILAFKSVCGWTHDTGPIGVHTLDWHNESVSRIVVPSYSFNNLDSTVISNIPDRAVTIDSRDCIRGAAFSIDVRDAYGFDINEVVTLTLIIASEGEAKGVAVNYDAIGGPRSLVHTSSRLVSSQLSEMRITLPDARLANRGDHSTDIFLASANPPLPGTQEARKITVCDVHISRSHQTKMPEAYGWLDIKLLDENDQATAARVGLYDVNGRLPLPSLDAVKIRKFSDQGRTKLLQKSTVWPHSNRFVFYIDGRYQARIPAGEYRLIATKGIEYRILNRKVTILPEKKSVENFRFERHSNMPANGWYSGDVHIHSPVNDEEDRRELLSQSMGEDIHIANILDMGNVSTTYFPPFIAGRKGRYRKTDFSLVPGQEDPRTLVFGHSIHLNTKAAVRFPNDYLNYSRVFEAVAAQGGVSGFAHSAWGLPGTAEGLAMQAVSGLVDFSEVMQSGVLGTDVWFSLLNLGYRIAPAAGSDYPYLDHIGAVRSYVKVGTDYDPDGWFKGLQAHKTFVTNGPVLELSINDYGPGDEISMGKGRALQVKATAQLNPDFGKLASLELIKHGEAVAVETSENGVEKMSLMFSERPSRSAWYVLRATGKKQGAMSMPVAITAPVYVVIDNEKRVWKIEAVADIVIDLLARLDKIKNINLSNMMTQEAWDTMPVWQKEFAKQSARARKRVEQIQQKLKDLAALATSQYHTERE